MTPDDPLDRMIDALLRQPVTPPDRALVDRILAVTSTQPEPAFSLWGLFTGWQRALAGAAICASLLAGLFSGWSEQGSPIYTNDDVNDVPGLTSAPGDWGDGQ